MESSSTTIPSATTAPTRSPTTLAPDTPTIQVFLFCDAPLQRPRDSVCPSRRPASGAPGVLLDALQQLFAGPNASEREAGLESYFSGDTEELLRDLNLSDGTATVDLEGDILARINGVGTTYGSSLFLAQVEGTVFQFPTVQEIVFKVDGDPRSFCRALEASEDCNPWTRAHWERP
jgi:hypothetical protein